MLKKYEVRQHGAALGVFRLSDGELMETFAWVQHAEARCAELEAYAAGLRVESDDRSTK